MNNGNYSGGNQSDMNRSGFCSVDVTTEEQVGKILGYSIIIFFSLVGNILVVIVITRDQRMKTNTNRFIVNMCISDLVATIHVLPMQVMFILSVKDLWLIPGVFGEFVCKLIPFIRDVCFAVSIFSMTVIALDRYLAIVYPYKAHSVTTKGCFIIIAVIWIVAIIMNTHYFVAMKVLTDNSDPVCRQIWSNDRDEHFRIQKIITTANLGVVVVAPLTSIVFFYTRVVMELYCRSNALEQSREQRRVRSKENREVAIMLISVVALFTASWAPICILIILQLYEWELFASDFCSEKTLRFILLFLSHSNVAQNAFIYFSFNKRFKNGLKKLLGSNCADPGAQNFSEYTNGISTVGLSNLKINNRAALQEGERIRLTTSV